MADVLRFSQQDWLDCCGSSKFAAEMVMISPFSTLQEALQMSNDIWWNKVDIPGWLEAFAAHPRIGDVEALRKKAESNADWCKSEQSVALSTSNDHILQELAEWNRQYEAKFGFCFLICASGKSSSEILADLKERFSNRPINELQVAAAEQQKITELRLAKLVAKGGSSNASRQSETHVTISDDSKNFPSAASVRPPITTHVLDVSSGRPGSGIEVSLDVLEGLTPGIKSQTQSDQAGAWTAIGHSITNEDGRSGPLMAPSGQILAGVYRLTFATGRYYTRLQESSGIKEFSGGFYPHVSVIFEVKPSQTFQHFHVPLLLAPYSYTTYRGS
ncbi:hypothetical protein O6H91_01G038000 [Diphasiastrum complanatum]|uniref:Uncharacterized protein n=1 Tax=Diphasiastrum complanatum TaxID=34168 RepID=A0ACC2EQ62_DIPCM|nr:hypothetical protein O6H91_01G038000 [Diphasiastrum complanatum]